MTKTLFAALVALTSLTGCAEITSLDAAGYGSARISTQAEARSIQFVAGDIHAVKVTVTNAADNTVVAVADFLSSSGLSTHLVGGVFSCTIDNLKVKDGSTPSYSYKAKVETYLEDAETTLIGSSESSAFTVTSALTPASVALPNLTLAATPVGSGSSAVTIIDTPAPAVVIR